MDFACRVLSPNQRTSYARVGAVVSDRLPVLRMMRNILLLALAEAMDARRAADQEVSRIESHLERTEREIIRKEIDESNHRTH